MRSHEETLLLANECSRRAQRMGPILPDNPTREELLRWCIWCDPNGVYTDESCKAEGMPKLTHEEAWACVEHLTE